VIRTLVLIGLASLAAAYAAGWCRLARRAPGVRPPVARLALGVAGLGTVGVALASPLDAAAHGRFSIHMLQHLLLVAGAAPALVAADPFPAVLWALPRPARRAAAAWLRPGGAVRRVLGALVSPAVAWTLHAATFWLWHAPALYDRALESDLIHVVEHAAFLGTAILFWWPVLDPAPRVRARPPAAARMAYLVLGAFQSAALGLWLTASPSPLYAAYARAPDALDDQVAGGVLMWALTGAADMAGVLLMAWRLMGPAARAPAYRPWTGPPVTADDTPAAGIAGSRRR
jgi:cytochrome c oxidase assembly factor CtaG